MKVAIITGANGALGKATALELARQGWSIGMVVRDQNRGSSARDTVAQTSGNANVHLLLTDLSSPDSIRRMTAAALEKFPRIDALIHTAAVYRSTRYLTVEKFEAMFATNHLGVFLLTNLLLEPLKASSPARVLVVSAPSTTRLNFDDLQGEKNFNAFNAFGATKMANLLFSFDLARRLEGAGVTVNAFHPGIVKSNIMGDAPALIRWMSKLMGSGPEKPAADLAALASAPEFANLNGKFLKGRTVIQPNAYALDQDIQRQLWEASTKLLKMN